MVKKFKTLKVSSSLIMKFLVVNLKQNMINQNHCIAKKIDCKLLRLPDNFTFNFKHMYTALNLKENYNS